MEHSGSVFDCSRARSCATSRNKSSGWLKDADMKMGDWIQSTPGRNNNLQMRSRKLRRGIIELQKMLGLVGLTFFALTAVIEFRAIKCLCRLFLAPAEEAGECVFHFRLDLCARSEQFFEDRQPGRG
jgi:hypothetical protein